MIQVSFGFTDNSAGDLGKNSLCGAAEGEVALPGVGERVGVELRMEGWEQPF